MINRTRAGNTIPNGAEKVILASGTLCWWFIPFFNLTDL